MNKNLNTLLAVLCFFGGLALIVFGMFQAPAWVQNIIIGFVLLAISQKFISNVNAADSSK